MKKHKSLHAKQSVINTLERVGIYPDYLSLVKRNDQKVTVYNRFGGGSCETTPLVSYLIEWVYRTSNEYERGFRVVNISDFDRIRYFILDLDSNAYMTCID